MAPREPIRPIIAILALTLMLLGAAQARELPDFSTLVKRNSAAVVNISTTQKVTQGVGRFVPDLELPELPPGHPLQDFLDRFRGPDGAPPEDGFDAQSLGSGFIISGDGHILTNYHVVRDAAEIIVRLSDRREFVAKNMGFDERSDLALLKIDAGDLPVVRLGKSAELEVGEWVLAIGSPFGFEHSATAGIVSAKGRSLPQENYVPFIQTDVAINPGNSGGPLFNLDGEVVGINSQIYSRTGGFMGLSFAIPIELAMQIADQLKQGGKVSRGWLGVMIQDVTRELAESFGMSRPTGALVAEVLPGSPADKAGIRVGDVIVEYDGREVTTSAMLPPMVGISPVGESVPVTVIRDGKPRQLKVLVAQLPDEPGAAEPPREPAPDGARDSTLGLVVEPLTAAESETLGVDGGLRVLEVLAGPAREGGVQPGDVLTLLNHRPLTDVKDLRDAVAQLPRGRSVPLLIYRQDTPRFIALRIPQKK